MRRAQAPLIGTPLMHPIGFAAQYAALGSDVPPLPEDDVEPELDVDPEVEPEPELLLEVELELFDATLTPFVTIAPEGVIACQMPPPP